MLNSEPSFSPANSIPTQHSDPNSLNTSSGVQPISAPILKLINLADPCPPDHWAIERAKERGKILKDDILSIANSKNFSIGSVDVILNGSMATGHFTGLKPREHSLNPYCPTQYTSVLEADLRILLEVGKNPHDPTICEIIREAIQKNGPIQSENLKTIDRWGRPIKMSYFYQYETLANGSDGLEWEICVNNHPYFEIAHVWQQVFTPDELAAQVKQREALRSMVVSRKLEFEPAKQLHCADCLWRAVAIFAIQDLVGASKIILDNIPTDFFPNLPSSQRNTIIDELSKIWMAGEGKEFMYKPLSQLPDISQKKIDLEIANTELALGPAIADGLRNQLSAIPPRWTNVASEIQKLLAANPEILNREDSKIHIRDDGQNVLVTISV
jgi:hypothetical protein